ncbi:MAG: nitronate monooxygenase [Bdellovibrio sp.]|nr:MAG: nitronate monooxygenase [Bdellovibrio sp.]
MKPEKIVTPFSKNFCQYPIIAAPMFLVSNEQMVIAVSEAGGIGAFPALNFRPIENYKKALKRIKAKTKRPIAVNIIVNKTNTRQKEDLKYALDAGVEMLITSLGSPKTVIQEAHKNGTKVYCDVTNLQHALKVQDMGADGVIAVSAGAGGHAGPLSPFALIPWLKEKLEIPIIAAGGIANGATMAAALALGASGVSVGTRFIASKEAKVSPDYKKAIINATPEDIVLTSRISGTPASVIKTPVIEKEGLDLPLLIRWLKNNPRTKKYIMPFIHYWGMKRLEVSARNKLTWKSVWSAGQTVGLIHEELSCKEIIEKLVQEYQETKTKLP